MSAAGVKAYRERHRAAGLCLQCFEPVADGNVSYCEKHRAKYKRSQKRIHGARYLTLVRKSKCIACGAPSATETHCLECAEKKNRRENAFYWECREAGVCAWRACGKPAPDTAYCEEHRAISAQRAAERRARRR